MAAPAAGLRTGPRQELYALAQERNIRGRSKMGKWDLIRALRALGRHTAACMRCPSACARKWRTVIC